MRYVSHDFIQVCDVRDIFYAQARTKAPIAHHNRDSIKARTIFCCENKKAFQRAKQLVAFMLLFYLQIKPDLQLQHFQSSTKLLSSDKNKIVF